MIFEFLFNLQVLHYDPVLVDSDALHTIRDTAHDDNVKKMFVGFYEQNQLLTKEQVAQALGMQPVRVAQVSRQTAVRGQVRQWRHVGCEGRTAHAVAEGHLDEIERWCDFRSMITQARACD